MDHSYPTPEENLACDEALLDEREHGNIDELLRFWQTDKYFVVLGYTNDIEREVRTEECHAYGIPVLRRFSGGGTVLQGPGCINYSLFLSLRNRPRLATIVGTNVFVMEQHRDHLRELLGPRVEFQGTSDLTIGNRKFSGNAQRRRRNFVVFHGTFLLSMDMHLMNELLPLPSREPGYRKNRSHSDFLMNIGLQPETIMESLRSCWNADRLCTELPDVQQLVRTRYHSPEWRH